MSSFLQGSYSFIQQRTMCNKTSTVTYDNFMQSNYKFIMNVIPYSVPTSIAILVSILYYKTVYGWLRRCCKIQYPPKLPYPSISNKNDRCLSEFAIWNSIIIIYSFRQSISHSPLFGIIWICLWWWSVKESPTDSSKSRSESGIWWTSVRKRWVGVVWLHFYTEIPIAFRLWWVSYFCVHFYIALHYI